jgi:hypothetical protein
MAVPRRSTFDGVRTRSSTIAKLEGFGRLTMADGRHAFCSRKNWMEVELVDLCRWDDWVGRDLDERRGEGSC